MIYNLKRKYSPQERKKTCDCYFFKNIVKINCDSGNIKYHMGRRRPRRHIEANLKRVRVY